MPVNFITFNSLKCSFHFNNLFDYLVSNFANAIVSNSWCDQAGRLQHLYQGLVGFFQNGSKRKNCSLANIVHEPRFSAYTTQFQYIRSLFNNLFRILQHHTLFSIEWLDHGMISVLPLSMWSDPNRTLPPNLALQFCWLRGHTRGL